MFASLSENGLDCGAVAAPLNLPRCVSRRASSMLGRLAAGIFGHAGLRSVLHERTNSDAHCGTYAAAMAAGIGADVTILDIKVARLQELDAQYRNGKASSHFTHGASSGRKRPDCTAS